MTRKIFSLVLFGGLAASGSALARPGSPISEPGLLGRTDILYFEDFETDRSGADTTEDSARVKFGRRSMRAMYKAGGHGTVGKPRRSPKFPRKLERFYVRQYIMFAEDFDFAQGGKITGTVNFAPGKRWKAGFGGKPSHGDDGFSCRLCWGRGGRMTMYTYHADMRGRYGSGFRAKARFQPGTWQCVELMVKINTPGKAPGEKGAHDGEVRLWVDGKMVGEKTGIRFRDIPELALDGWDYGFYFGGTWVCPKDQYIYMDNVVIAHNYIGPAVFKRPMPKAKAARPLLVRPKPKPEPLAPFKDQLADVRKQARSGAFAAAARALDPVLAAAPGREGAGALAVFASGIQAGAELKKRIIAGAAGSRPKVYIDFGGRTTRVKLLAADADGATFELSGSELPMRWAQLAPNRFYGIARKFAPDTPENHLLLARYCAAMGLADAARAEIESASADSGLRPEADRLKGLVP